MVELPQQKLPEFAIAPNKEDKTLAAVCLLNKGMIKSGGEIGAIEQEPELEKTVTRTECWTNLQGYSRRRCAPRTAPKAPHWAISWMELRVFNLAPALFSRVRNPRLRAGRSPAGSTRSTKLLLLTTSAYTPLAAEIIIKTAKLAFRSLPRALASPRGAFNLRAVPA